jgi:hypothetical protein
MPHPLRELSGTAGAPGEAATSSRPRGSLHAPFNEILETTALVLADETITVEPCKALIRGLVTHYTIRIANASFVTTGCPPMEQPRNSFYP